MDCKNILSSSGVEVISTYRAMYDRTDLKTPEAKKNEIKEPTYYIRKGTREEAVRRGIVPLAYKDCEFNIELITSNLKNQNKKAVRKFKIINFPAYEITLKGILSTVIANKIPEQSYIIGAPSGFGKTSFANHCITLMYEQGRLCVPFISLTELAQVRLAEQRKLLKGISSYDFYHGNVVSTKDEYESLICSELQDKAYVKRPIDIIAKFSWSEFIESDMLFCYFTNVESKVLESEIFKTVLTIRGSKGLPTIAMISTSLDPYKSDTYLREYVWNEILEYKNDCSYDRVKHISCWKDYNAPLISKDD